MKSQALLAYVAGIVDGEGHIGIEKMRSPRYKKGFQFELVTKVVNTSERLIQWLKMQFAGSIMWRKGSKANHKDSWVWTVEANRAANFLQLILPYLRLKQPQAKIGIEFQAKVKRAIKNRRRGLTDEEFALQEAKYILLKNLNKRGKECEA
jgi:hypothetical protein